MIWKRIRKILLWFIVTILLLFVILYLLIRQPAVQTWLVHKVSNYLSEKLNTKVTVQSVNIQFLTSAVIDGVYVEDQQKDTLLYAGKLKATFGVMQLFSQNFEVTNLSLEDVRVRLYRSATDTDFNYQFIADAFASNDTTQSGGKNPTLRIGTIHLKNISVTYRDEPAIDFTAHLPEFVAEFNHLNLDQPLLDLKKIQLDNADVVVTKLYDSTAHHSSSSSDDEEKLVHLNTKSFQLLVDEFKMNNVHFRYEVENTPHDTALFDQNHIEFTNINMDVRNGKFIMDTITAVVKNISCNEKSGLVVKEFSGDARVTPTESSFENLTVKLPRSEVHNSFSFQYLTFRDFYSFISNVYMRADLKNSHICLNDFSCFAPELKKMFDPMEVTGRLSGTVDNLKLKELDVKAANQTMFKGKAVIQGLPSVSDMYFELQMDEATTSASDLKIIYPDAVLPKEIYQAGLISLKGNMSGFLNDFVTNMVVFSNLGEFSSDLNMKLNENKIPEYSGSLQTSNFNLGHLLGIDSTLGKVSLTTTVNGKGFDVSMLNSKLVSHIDKIELLGYPYHNLDVNGAINEKVFNGKLLLDDKNIFMDFQGSINLLDSIPSYDFTATVKHANLDSLGFISRRLTVSSNLDINLKGKNPLTGTGNITATKTLFFDGEDTFLVKHFVFNVEEISSQKKNLTVRSDFADVDVSGKFNLPEVPAAFVNVIKNYLPSLPVDLGDSIDAQRFDFSVAIKNMSNFNKYFLKGIEGLSNTNINGHFASDSNLILLDGMIPYVKYGETYSNDLMLYGESNNGTLNLSLTSHFLHINDSLKIVDPFVSAALADNSVLFNIKANDQSGNYKIDLLASARGENDFIKMKFLPSNILLNNQSWNFESGNQITIGKKSLLFTNTVLAHNSQFIKIENVETGDSSDVKFSFSNIHIEDFYNLFRMSEYDVKGNVNGSASIMNLFESPRYSANLVVDQFNFNGDSADKVIAKVDYNSVKDEMTIDAKVKDDLYDVEVNGTYAPAAAENSLNLKVEVVKVELPIVGKYLSDYVSKVHGKIAGQLFLKGTVAQPKLTGSLVIPDAGAEVTYLKTSYTFSGASLKFDENKIDFGSITLYDDTGNVALVNGSLHHNYLSDFGFDIHLTTKNFHMLNTTQFDNSLFYGYAYAGGTLDVTGGVNDLQINATLESKRGTNISIPVTDDASVSGNSFVRFVKRDSSLQIVQSVSTEEESNIKLNFDLSLNPLAKVNIIFDQKAGDIISGTGNGNLRLEIGLDGTFNMYGNYVIEKGDYLFTLQNFFNKRFSVEKGGTIAWNGDPYEAQVDINAIYSLSRVSFADLVSQNLDQMTDAERKEIEKKVPVDVYMHLTGSLLTPNIDFDIRQPKGEESINSFASRKLGEIRNDENELNKQVFGLLMLNRFLPPDAASAGGLVQSGVNTSVSEFIFNQFSYYASQNKWKIGVNFNLENYGSVPNAAGTTTQDINATRRELQLVLTKTFFHDRVSIDVGGNVDINNSSATKASGAYLSDFTIEYKITPDGRFVAKAFNRSQYDVLEERNRDTYGVSLSFKKDFNKLKELFISDRVRKRNIKFKN